MDIRTHRAGSTVDSSIVAARSEVVRRSSTICPGKSTDSREKVRIISRSWEGVRGGGGGGCITYLGDSEPRPGKEL